MRTEYIGIIDTPSGYFGDTEPAHLCYDPETLKTYSVYPFGWHTSEIPPAISKEEVVWLINNHPILTGRFSL